MASPDFSSSRPSAKEDQPSVVKNNNGDKDRLMKYIDGEREMTDEEHEQYRAAVYASDGFDVPSFPDDICACCLITPIILDDYFREELKPFCVAALKDYNEKKNTDYEFLHLEKANGQAERGILYYLTFVGRIAKDNTSQVFEACVLRGVPKNIEDDGTEVYFCREKATPSKSDV